jgi:LPS sulfotransferase NodH
MLLSDLLGQTNLFGVPMEYFNDDYFNQWTSDRGLPFGANKFYSYLQEVETLRSSASGVFGFKLHYFQMIHVRKKYKFNLFKHLEDKDVLWVHLFRQNRIEQAVSLFRAIRTDHWLASDASTEHGLSSESHSSKSIGLIDYSFDEILSLYRFLSREELGWQAFFRARNINPVTLTYEQLSNEQPSWIVDRLVKEARLRFSALTLPDIEPLIAQRIHKQSSATDDLIQRFQEDYDRVLNF